MFPPPTWIMIPRDLAQQLISAGPMYTVISDNVARVMTMDERAAVDAANAAAAEARMALMPKSDSQIIGEISSAVSGDQALRVINALNGNAIVMAWLRIPDYPDTAAYLQGLVSGNVIWQEDYNLITGFFPSGSF